MLNFNVWGIIVKIFEEEYLIWRLCFERKGLEIHAMFEVEDTTKNFLVEWTSDLKSRIRQRWTSLIVHPNFSSYINLIPCNKYKGRVYHQPGSTRRRPVRLTSQDDLRPPQAQVCGRWAAGSSPTDQDRTRVDGALCSTRVSKSCQKLLKGPDIGPTRRLSAEFAGTVQTRYRRTPAGTWATEGKCRVFSQ